MACRRHCTEMNVNVHNVLKNKRIIGYTREAMLYSWLHYAGPSVRHRIFKFLPDILCQKVGTIEHCLKIKDLARNNYLEH